MFDACREARLAGTVFNVLHPPHPSHFLIGWRLQFDISFSDTSARTVALPILILLYIRTEQVENTLYLYTCDAKLYFVQLIMLTGIDAFMTYDVSYPHLMSMQFKSAPIASFTSSIELLKRLADVIHINEYIWCGISIFRIIVYSDFLTLNFCQERLELVSNPHLRSVC